MLKIILCLILAIVVVIVMLKISLFQTIFYYLTAMVAVYTLTVIFLAITDSIQEWSDEKRNGKKK